MTESIPSDLIPLCDAHAHLADSRLHGRVEALLRHSRERGVVGILAAAARRDEWPELLRLAQVAPEVHVALGLHPFFLDQWDEELPVVLARERLAHPQAVRAVGEVGLDFYPRTLAVFPRAVQLERLEEQLAVAAELALPVIFHNRRSWEHFFPLWKQWRTRIPGGVLHHFTGGRELAQQALSAGLMLSFCGPLTWPAARRIKEAAAITPLDRMLTETDTPDLPGEAHRGEESEPWQVGAVVAEIARLQEREVAKVATAVLANYRRLLGLPADSAIPTE